MSDKLLALTPAQRRKARRIYQRREGERLPYKIAVYLDGTLPPMSMMRMLSRRMVQRMAPQIVADLLRPSWLETALAGSSGSPVRIRLPKDFTIRSRPKL